MNIPLETITGLATSLTAIRRGTDIGVSVEFDNSWTTGGYRVTTQVKLTGVDDLTKLAHVCHSLNRPLILNQQVELTGLGAAAAHITGHHNAEGIQATTRSRIGSQVRYFADPVFEGKPLTLAPEEFACGYENPVVLYIHDTPVEVVEAGHTFRIISGSRKVVHEGTVEFVFAVNETHPVFNYLDRGHTLAFQRHNDRTHIMVTDSLTLDMNYVLAAFAVHPPSTVDHARDGLFFFGNGADARIRALRIEQAIPARKKDWFRGLKAEVLGHYGKNAQNTLVTKYQRGEVDALTLNDIKFTGNRAVYDVVSLEAENLKEVLFSNIDSNGQFDIYQLVQVYSEWILKEVETKARNTAGTAFLTPGSWLLRVNGIDVRVSVDTTSTRRRVNGKLINTAEVIRVINRAACFTTQGDYDTFVRSVARMTLEVRDLLANGIPIALKKTTSRATQPAALTVPARMLFKKEAGRYFLVMDAARTEFAELQGFLAFTRKIRAVNDKTDGGYTYDRLANAGTYRDGDWCRRHVKNAISEHGKRREHQEASPGSFTLLEVATTTATQRDLYIDTVLLVQSAEEKRSLELLADIVTKVKAVETTRAGLTGYVVTGKLATYFVERSSPHKVWIDTNDTNVAPSRYVCIVDFNRDAMGAGFDALVARILSVANDSRLAVKIHTLTARVS